MSGYYKAEKIHDMAVQHGYTGHWDGSTTDAVRCLMTALEAEEGANFDTDADAFESMLAEVTPVETETEEEPVVTPVTNDNELGGGE